MIIRHDGRMQVCCDFCPAAHPNSYAADDFNVMIIEAKTAGWAIRPAPKPAGDTGTDELFGSSPRVAGAASAEAPQKYIHTCPACLEAEREDNDDVRML